MRHYPQNSPQAAARIVALALLADGHVSKRELQSLDEVNAHGQLGLTRQELHAVVQTFCEDLLIATQLARGTACRVDGATMAEMMAEIDDLALWHKVMKLCGEVIDADGHVSDGESIVMRAAADYSRRQSQAWAERDKASEVLHG